MENNQEKNKYQPSFADTRLNTRCERNTISGIPETADPKYASKLKTRG